MLDGNIFNRSRVYFRTERQLENNWRNGSNSDWTADVSTQFLDSSFIYEANPDKFQVESNNTKEHLCFVYCQICAIDWGPAFDFDESFNNLRLQVWICKCLNKVYKPVGCCRDMRLCCKNLFKERHARAIPTGTFAVGHPIQLLRVLRQIVLIILGPLLY